MEHGFAVAHRVGDMYGARGRYCLRRNLCMGSCMGLGLDLGRA